MVVRDRMLNLVLHAFDTRHRRPPTEPFEDEFHPRLRYVHRGLVAMANNGTKNSNDSQFFITLGALFFSPRYAYSPCFLNSRGSDRADELQGKHTLFGRVIGDTLYSTPHDFLAHEFNH